MTYNLWDLTNLKYIMHYISSFKITYLNAWGRSVWPKHVASIDMANKKFALVNGNKYVNFNTRESQTKTLKVR